jgi:hypothetical protein
MAGMAYIARERQIARRRLDQQRKYDLIVVFQMQVADVLNAKQFTE